MRIVFAGTPDFAVPSLQALIRSQHEVLAVYTQPDRPKGRGQASAASPVKIAAKEAGIPVLQPATFQGFSDKETLKAFQPDYLVVAAYGLLLPKSILAVPKRLPINVHASLLPRWRGASPIQQAILAGDQETGVTIMKMVQAMDAGDPLYSLSCSILSTDTTQTLHDKLALLGAEALLRYLKNPDAYPGKEQDLSGVTYAGKINKQDAVLDWKKPAAVLERSIRAYNPWPIAQFEWDKLIWRLWQATAFTEPVHALPGEVIAVNKQGIVVATGNGSLRLERLQKPGGKPLPVSDLLNANHFVVKPGMLIT